MFLVYFCADLAFPVSHFFVGQCKPGVLLLQVQLLVQYILNLFKEQELFGSFVLLYLGSIQPFIPLPGWELRHAKIWIQ